MPTLFILATIVCFIQTGFAVDNDTVKIGRPYVIKSINFPEGSGHDWGICLLYQEGLMRFHVETGELEGVLAESVELMKNGKDLKIKLRKGSKFHTGDPVTAHDVKFSVEQAVDPQNAFSYSFMYDEIEEVEILDDHTLIYRFYEPYAAWERLIRGAILSKKYYEKAGREKFRKHPVGSGPYRFVEYKVNEYLLLEAVENHPFYNVDFKKMKLITIKDPLTAIAMLSIGELDLVQVVLPHQMKQLQRQKHIKVKTTSRVPHYVGINTSQLNYPILKDRKLIRAINLAINRQEIIDRVYLGQGYPLYGSYMKEEIGYDPTYTIEFNPQKARELVKQSSYKPGTPLLLTYGHGTFPNISLVGTIVQKYLQNVGIN